MASPSCVRNPGSLLGISLVFPLHIRNLQSLVNSTFKETAWVSCLTPTPLWLLWSSSQCWQPGQSLCWLVLCRLALLESTGPMASREQYDWSTSLNLAFPALQRSWNLTRDQHSWACPCALTLVLLALPSLLQPHPYLLVPSDLGPCTCSPLSLELSARLIPAHPWDCLEQNYPNLHTSSDLPSILLWYPYHLLHHLQLNIYRCDC